MSQPLSSDPAVRVFIVEDYGLFRAGLIASLNTADTLSVVGEAESAEEALVKLAEISIDVLLLDLGLPGMNGLEMAQKVREKWPEIRIIVLTSHNDPEEVLAMFAVGAQAYALKDIRPERLAQVIEMVHEGACWLDPGIAGIVMDNLHAPGPSSSGTSTGISNIDLTSREKEVLELLVKGYNNKEISEALYITIHTTKAHISSILGKLSVSDRVQAVIKAMNENLV